MEATTYLMAFQFLVCITGFAFQRHDFSNIESSAPFSDGNHERAAIVRQPKHADRDRRKMIFGPILAAFVPTSHAKGEEMVQSISVPLLSAGNAYLIYYRVDGSLFRAVLDTGSPFLMIPGSCGQATKSKAGCYKQQGSPSGLASTFEQFDGFSGEVEWRSAPFSFNDATGSMMGPQKIVFGVASESIMSGPGGIFFGLIRDTDDWIRPSFLKQTNVKAFIVDLASPNKALTLSTAPTIRGDYIPMSDILRRRFGAPVSHYSAVLRSITTNGYPLVPSDGKPIYVIFDTGVTGMIVSQQLFDERYLEARQRKEKSLWGNVTLTFATSQGGTVDLVASKPITTSFDPKVAWKKFRGHLIVMGLAFLDGNVLSVDIDLGKVWVDVKSQ